MTEYLQRLVARGAPAASQSQLQPVVRTNTEGVPANRPSP